MKNVWPEQAFVKTILAYDSTTHEKRAGANKSIVMKSLDDWDAKFTACVVNGGRNERECIVKVRHIRVLAAEKKLELSI
jgi:hypothetical protein